MTLTIRSWALSALALFVLGCEDTRVDPLHGGLDSDTRALDFGAVWIGTPKTLSVSLRAGARPLRLRAEPLTEPAFTIQDLPSDLAAGAEAPISITFAPTGLGAKSATLSVGLDVPGAAPLLIGLRGEGRAPPDCEDHNDCTDDRFDPGSGQCEHAPREGSCDDHSACTEDDRCAAGVCLGRGIHCDDGVACTEDYCDPATGCTTRPNNAVCADADPCTLDVCTAIGCQNPVAPNGTSCGEVVSCVSAQICIFHNCVEVGLPEGVPCDDGDPCTVEDHCTAHVCGGRADATPPKRIADSYRVPDLRAAALVGDRVYLSSGPSLLAHTRERSYLLGEIGAFMGPSDAPLEGQADLVPIGQNRYARARNAATGTTAVVRVEIIDASDPAHPIVVAEQNAPGRRFLTGLSYTDQALFVCRSHSLAYVDLSDPLHPGPFVDLPDPNLGPCSLLLRPDLVDTVGEIWATAMVERETRSPVARVYRVSRQRAELILDNGWNPTGIHQYGDPITVATSTARAVYNLSNPGLLFWVSMDTATGHADWHMLAHGLNPRPDLLGVDGTVAWFFDTDRLRGIDLADPLNVVMVPTSIPVGPLVSPVRLLAQDATRFVLESGGGQVTVVQKLSAPSAPNRTVTGLGGIEELRPVPGGFGAFSRYGGGALYAEPALMTPTATTAPPFVAHIQALPAILDQGRAGVVVPQQIDSGLFAAGCDRFFECQQSDVYSFGPLGLLRPDLGTGPVFVPRPPPGITSLNAFAARGCQALAIGQPSTVLVSVDLCAPQPTFVAHPEWGNFGMDTSFTRGVDHGGMMSFLSDREARLVPTTTSAGFSRVRHIGAPIFSAGYDPVSTRWVLSAATGPGGSTELWVMEIGQPDRHFAVPELDAGGGAILAVRGRMALVAGDRQGEELLAYDLDRQEIVHRIPMSLPAISAEIEPHRVVVGRVDGVTVLGPICLPRD
ncbi:MAG: hypothetical protein U1E65_17645 [Myxococcota bacterium]